ncbi:HTH domain-containing protein [Fulvivirgaceae bacterium BMA10]|uniref:HTH domain-containing protein n=1 Tax=Splendidivirga corallicola TaxID=3051826 RepID=A0ABT8KNN5_9BACT|nr:HTH domain-containing protein [Fulvivirgaceae bacterium BMA10]
MAGLKYYERFKRLEKLIRLKATGSPKELAKKFEVSERTIYRLIESIELANNKKIKFSYEENSYIFFDEN